MSHRGVRSLLITNFNTYDNNFINDFLLFTYTTQQLAVHAVNVNVTVCSQYLYILYVSRITIRPSSRLSLHWCVTHNRTLMWWWFPHNLLGINQRVRSCAPCTSPAHPRLPVSQKHHLQMMKVSEMRFVYNEIEIITYLAWTWARRFQLRHNHIMP